MCYDDDGDVEMDQVTGYQVYVCVCLLYGVLTGEVFIVFPPVISGGKVPLHSVGTRGERDSMVSNARHLVVSLVRC